MKNNFLGTLVLFFVLSSLTMGKLQADNQLRPSLPLTPACPDILSFLLSPQKKDLPTTALKVTQNRAFDIAQFTINENNTVIKVRRFDKNQNPLDILTIETNGNMSYINTKEGYQNLFSVTPHFVEYLIENLRDNLQDGDAPRGNLKKLLAYEGLIEAFRPSLGDIREKQKTFRPWSEDSATVH